MGLDQNAQNHLDLLNGVIAQKHTYPENKYSGRGIVMGAGGAKFFTCAWAAVAVLRHVGCTLPIEFWILGRYELDPEMEAAALSLGVTLRNAEDVVAELPQPPRILNGWELKPFAVIHSHFEEVLYLDADNMAVVDPTFLFDHGAYKSYGAVFWPDLPPNNRSEWLPDELWERVGLVPRKDIDFESGQFLVNKRKCWKELMVTMHLNEYSDYWYCHMYGDKTTYHLAWHKLGTRYAIPDKPAGWWWPAILQHDFDGNVIFQHACQGKEAICESRVMDAITHSQVSAKAVLELRSRWCGRIWNFIGDRGLTGDYVYWRHSTDARIMSLGHSGQIIKGEARCERRWAAHDIDGELNLIIIGEAHKDQEIGMIFCKRNSSGIWCGRWTYYTKPYINLIPTTLLYT